MSFFSLSTHHEPKSFAEANKFECWKQAMQTELLALERAGTWQVVDIPRMLLLLVVDRSIM
jgi:hypothetical protein